jgi:large subunit ribosomal protein L3
MLDTLLGFKQKMGAVYINGRRYPVTWIKVDPCTVVQVKHSEKDGYMAVQLGIGSKKGKNLTKPLTGHLKKLTNTQNSTPRFLREVKDGENSNLNVGDVVKISDVFKKGDVITVTGVSKGKGFAGVVKRWRFAGGPKTHGQSDRGVRRSIDRTTRSGKRMAGRMGQDKVTVKGLVLLDIDEVNNVVTVKGPVPGVVGGLVYIRKTGEGELKMGLPVTEPAADKKEDEADQEENVKKEEQVETEENKADSAEVETNGDEKAVENAESIKVDKTDNK